jgi:hypothetical protein
MMVVSAVLYVSLAAAADAIVVQSDPCPASADAPPPADVDSEAVDLNPWRLNVGEDDVFEDIPLDENGIVYRVYIDPATGVPYSLEYEGPCEDELAPAE